MSDPRPENAARSAFHVGAGLLIMGLAGVMSPRAQLILASVLFTGGWTLEIVRGLSPRGRELLHRAYGPVMHDDERNRVTSSIWFITGLFFVVLYGVPAATGVAFGVHGLGDPAGGFFGRRHGEHPWPGRAKTLEGSAAYVAAAFVGAVVALMWALPSLDLQTAAAVAAAAAVAGAAAEVGITRLDDNFASVVAAGSVVALAANLGLLG